MLQTSRKQTSTHQGLIKYAACAELSHGTGFYYTYHNNSIQTRT